jgi:hypothetical protein
MGLPSGCFGKMNFRSHLNPKFQISENSAIFINK